MLSKNWGAQSYFFHILSGTKSGKKMFLYGYESVKLQKKKKKKKHNAKQTEYNTDSFNVC